MPGSETGTRAAGKRARPPLSATALPLLLEVGEAQPGEIADLRMGPVLGTGGMAVVRSAEQLALGRTVAVKIPRPFPEAQRALLDEALVAGAIEHPNVVPVHALGRDRSGHPLLVMKRIEGTPWAVSLASGNRPAQLRHHLGILTQVCHAIELAHARGIVHRDLKPQNVMIGRFGEVYVVDWGLAVSLRTATWLPRASDVLEIEGTPAYLAPEMLMPTEAEIGVASDIYLLGGLLHVVLTGEAPFRGADVDSRLAAPRAMPTDRLAASPALLAEICRKALASEPDQRFVSAAAFREALDQALERLASLDVTRVAAERLAALEACDDVVRLRELVVEARFGFREALHAWPKNPEALGGLQRTLELACEHEIEAENHAAAASLLAQLPEPNETLAHAVAALDNRLTARRAKVRRLEALEHAANLRVDAELRLPAIGAIGITAALVAAVVASLGASYGLAVGALVLLAVVAWLVQRVLFPTTNVVNRQLFRALHACLGGAAAVLCFAAWGTLPLSVGAPIAALTGAAALAALVMSVSLRWWPILVAAASAVVVATVSASPWIYSGGALVTALAAAWCARTLAKDGGGAETAVAAAPRGRSDVDPATLAARPRRPRDDATIRIAGDEERTTVAAPRAPAIAIAELPRIIAEGDSDEDGAVPQLRLGELTAKGGMSEIHAATQLPLDRRVAVKIPNDRDDAAQALLREAAVAGVLDHPNMVPVHALGRDAEGRPILVMKFIEGSPWLAALRQPDRLDQLDRHLGTLMQVCSAVDYAHHRGIIHRDIKASNVMVGAFGEVQLLDWGLAAALDSSQADTLPAAAGLRAVEGTAAYMAPEMLEPERGDIGVATDVYLLGGLLHVILMGYAPHAGATLRDRVAGAGRRPLSPAPRDVPRELVAICAQALAKDPGLRFESAGALRAALADYLQHKGSLELMHSANERVHALAAAIRAGADPSVVHELVTEARFGFAQALRSWPDNLQAREGLQFLLEMACEYELDRQQHDAAEALLAALPSPNRELASRLVALAAELASREDRLRDLQELQHGVDIAIDKRKRMWSAVALGLLIVLSIGGLMVARIAGWHQPGYLDAIVITALAAVTATVVRARQLRGTNEANLRIHRMLNVGLGGAVAHLCLCAHLGVDFTLGLALMLLLFVAIAAVASVTISPLIIPAAVAFAPAAVCLMLWPGYRPWFLLLAFGGAFGAMAVAARSIRPDEDGGDAPGGAPPP